MEKSTARDAHTKHGCLRGLSSPLALTAGVCLLMPLAAVGVAGLVAGCGGGTPAATGTTAVTTEGGVDGFVFGPGGRQTQDNVTLSATATAPAGTSPLGGATVTVTGATLTTTVAADGSFTLRGVPAGLRKLVVTPPGGAPVEFPLTVIGGSTIVVGSPAVTRDQAIEAVKAGVAQTQPVDTTFILGPHHPLPVGARVAPALGDDDGNDDPALVTALARAAWFFFVDLDPHTRFPHPTKFYFVDPDTADVTSVDATSWPSINGLNYYGLRDVNEQSPDLVQRPNTAVAVSSVRSAPVSAGRAAAGRDRVPNCPNPTTYGLLVQGSDESPMRADMSRITDVFGHGGIPAALVHRYKPPSNTPRQDVLALWNRICQQAQPCDTVLVFITSHGTRGGAAKLDTDAVNSDGRPVVFESLTALSFDLSKCKACHFIFIIDSCYAGRWIDLFKRQTEPPSARKVMVMTASDRRNQSVGIPTWDPRGRTGGVFTTQFVSAFSALYQSSPNGTVDLGRAFDDANTAIAGTAFPSAVRKQNPQYYFSWNQQPCGVPVVGGDDDDSGDDDDDGGGGGSNELISLDPAGLGAVHVVGTSPCPQALGTLTVRNVSNAVVEYSTSVNNSVFDLSKRAGHIQPGATLEIQVSFNCGALPPQSGTVTVVVTGEGGASQTKTAQISLSAGA